MLLAGAPSDHSSTTFTILSRSGFYSHYFLVPKKDGGLRPILALRSSRKYAQGTGSFLKDAYFHIQIAPHHRLFIRFAFEGAAYQYMVLPFALSLAPRTFTKCMDAALSPLRQLEIRILNYLDDWLTLAQSEDEFLYYRSVLLSHLEWLGFRGVNVTNYCT